MPATRTSSKPAEITPALRHVGYTPPAREPVCNDTAVTLPGLRRAVGAEIVPFCTKHDGSLAAGFVMAEFWDGRVLRGHDAVS